LPWLLVVIGLLAIVGLGIVLVVAGVFVRVNQ
jgi:hypothetical protein